MQYIRTDLHPVVREWTSGHRVSFRRLGREWNIGIYVNGVTRRFSAGWDRFVRDNELNVDDVLVFTLLPDLDTFDVGVVEY